MWPRPDPPSARWQPQEDGRASDCACTLGTSSSSTLGPRTGQDTARAVATGSDATVSLGHTNGLSRGPPIGHP